MRSAAGFHGPGESPELLAGQAVKAWQLAYCRAPESEELATSMAFLSDQIKYLQANKNQLPSGVTEFQRAADGLLPSADDIQ
ncbi:MAG: hypothetical protein R3C49_01670 [Planctomycetaceae bacterium]